MKKRIIISVSNDLATDQRVRKQCDSLHKAGYELCLVGRLLSGSLPLERPYRTHRMKMWFRKKAAFYAELNVRLFWRLVVARVDLYYANDLDTLPANALASLIRRKPLVYDSHEFFTEVPEIQGRKWVKKTWSLLENLCIARASVVLTVNQSIAGLLEQAYALSKVHVVRNVPDGPAPIADQTHMDLALPAGQQLVILQGSGINVDRGAEELLEAMALTEGVHLLIIGSGDAIPALKRRAKSNDLKAKVTFIPRMPYGQMMQYTAMADLGVSLDKDTNLNYRYSLPNKVFDYVAAGVPVLVTDLVEVRRFVTAHGLGVVAHSLDPAYLSALIRDTLNDPASLSAFRENARRTAPTLLWSREYAPVVEAIGQLTGAPTAPFETRAGVHDLKKR